MYSPSLCHIISFPFFESNNLTKFYGFSHTFLTKSLYCKKRRQYTPGVREGAACKVFPVYKICLPRWTTFFHRQPLPFLYKLKTCPKKFLKEDNFKYLFSSYCAKTVLDLLLFLKNIPRSLAGKASFLQATGLNVMQLLLAAWGHLAFPKALLQKKEFQKFHPCFYVAAVLLFYYVNHWKYKQ